MAGDREARTEKPTPRRMRKAREEGQIPRSQELLAWTSMLAVVFLIQITVKVAGQQFRPLMAQSFDVIGHPDQGKAIALFGKWMISGLIVLAPLLFGTMIVGVAVNLAQVGFAPSFKL